MFNLTSDAITLLADDQGIAANGSETTLIDLSKNWEGNIWAGATLLISIEDTLYIRKVTSNTNTKITFNALPIGVRARKDDKWALKQALKTQFTPIEKANEHNLSVTADANILSTDLIPTNTPCLFRIMVCIDGTGVFSVMMTKGGSEQKLKLNEAANLAADAVYMFDILVHSGDSVNFQHSATATLKALRVEEIIAASQ